MVVYDSSLGSQRLGTFVTDFVAAEVNLSDCVIRFKRSSQRIGTFVTDVTIFEVNVSDCVVRFKRSS